MMRNSVQNEAFQNLLLIFADLFRFPEEEFYAEITEGRLDEQIKELSRAAGLPIVTELKEQIGSYQELVESFNHCFLGVRTPFAPPVESVYKIWTTDESYQVPYKNQKGYLMGDCALHIRHILEAFGLEIPEDYGQTPDHLIILLELYAYLLGRGLLDEAKQFHGDHLDWLPDFGKAIKAIEPNSFYAYIVQILCQVLTAQELGYIN